VGYNLCSSTFERKRGLSWSKVGALYGPGIGCLTINFGLAPGEVAPFTAKLPAGLIRGTYRIRTEVEIRDGSTVRVTEAFVVR
jgi:hypothetical protein